LHDEVIASPTKSHVGMRPEQASEFFAGAAQKKKGSGTENRRLALSYPGVPASLDVNQSMNASFT
jgi:hypothetical protein